MSSKDPRDPKFRPEGPEPTGGADEREPDFRNANAEDPGSATRTKARIEQLNSLVIGPYKLLQQIGEGGMGTVWLAEQERPVRRRVALKLIKSGSDSKQVLARFEAERQSLSMMDHQNIAKILDVGTMQVGRPYFVMELVQGLPFN